MGGVVSGITDAVGLTDTKDAGDQARKASREQAAWQQRGLDYMMEREELPQQFREGALTKLGGMYGLEGGEGNQQEMIDFAQQSPIYKAIMGGRQAGEQAIMRNAGQTGGLRSGNVQHNLYDYNTQLQNQATLTGFNQQMAGLQGLADLPTNTNAIAGAMGGIGQTLAQGRVADKQAQITAENKLWADITGAAAMGAKAGGMGGFGAPGA